MECYHCATIHPELTEVLPEFAEGYAAQYFVGHGAEFAPDRRASPSTAARASRCAGRRRRAGPPVLRDHVKPQVFVNLVPDHVIVHRMTPLAVDRTHGGVRLAVRARGGRVRPDVVEVGRAVPPGQHSGLRRLRAHPARDELAGVPRRRRARSGEHHIGAFHDWVRDRID